MARKPCGESYSKILKYMDLVNAEVTVDEVAQATGITKHAVYQAVKRYECDFEIRREPPQPARLYIRLKDF